MTDMESVSDNKDELLFDLLKDVTNDEDADADVPVAANANENRIVVCVICRASPELSVIFTLCKQLNLCGSCYEQYRALNLAAYNDMISGMVIDVPPFRMKCPSCRTLHLESQILTGVFTP